VNLRERHSHTFKDPHKTERCDAALLLAAGDALAAVLGRVAGDCYASESIVPCPDHAASATALAAWRKATDGR